VVRTLGNIAVSVTLVLGLGAVVLVFSGTLFHFAYGSPISVTRSLIIFAFGCVALVIGQRLLGIGWNRIAAMIVVFLGLALASAPLNTRPVSGINPTDLVFIVVGIAMILGGLWASFRARKQLATEGERTSELQ
jgi:hypothetical protein